MSFWNKINPFGSLKKAKDSKDSNGAITTPRVQEDTKTPISKTRFGKELRKDFLFDEKYLNLNHGTTS